MNGAEVNQEKSNRAGAVRFAVWCALAFAVVPFVMAPFAAAQFGAAQFELPDADLIVLTPEVALGEAARVEVTVPQGLDFDLTLDWGDGFTDNVDRFGADVQTFEHTFSSPGLKS